MHWKEAEAEMQALRKKRLLDLLDIVNDQEIEVPQVGTKCHWTDKAGVTHWLYHGNAIQRGEPVDGGPVSGAEFIWREVGATVAALSLQEDMPTSALTFKVVKKEIMGRQYCPACKSEVATLFRIVEKVAKERKLL